MMFIKKFIILNLRRRIINMNKDVIKRLLKYLNKNIISLIITFVLAIASVLLTIYVPILFGNAIDLIVDKDNVNFDGPEEIINKVSIGWNLLYLKDGYGCKDTLAFKIDPIEIIPDKYFTPNGDNNHEEWTVKNLNTYDSYIVEIFDRYGKRLFVQRVGSFSSTGKSDVTGDEFKGWDGIYNGHPMPSDDYWYLITVEEIRKQYTGHFTLKR